MNMVTDRDPSRTTSAARLREHVRPARRAWGVLVLLALVATSCRSSRDKDNQNQSVPSNQPAAPAGTTYQGDWPVFRGDAQSTGAVAEPLVDSLDVVWRLDVERARFESTPAIADGVVYIGDMNGRLLSIDLETGQQRWSLDGSDGYLAAPAIRGDALFIGDVAGTFRCVGTDGQERWSVTAGATIDSGANFHGDHVLVGSQDAVLYALDAQSGDEAWRHETADQIRCTPTIAADRTFVAGCDGFLHIINLADGAGVAEVEIESPTGVTPALLGDRIFFGTEQNGFFAIDWRRAATVWTFDDPEGAVAFRGSPAVVPGHVVTTTRGRKVFSLDPETGTVQWSYLAPGAVDSSPVIAGQRVYIASADGRLYVLRLDNGELVAEHELGGRLLGSPALSRGRLVVATDRGSVFCLGPRATAPVSAAPDPP